MTRKTHTVASDKPTIKSPLRYPGGKSRAISKISEFLPDSFNEYREPFVGGGSLFIHVRQVCPEVSIWINDLNHELYCFWLNARDNLKMLASEVLRVKRIANDGKKVFTELTAVDPTTLSSLERAVRFFILNRISFSGTVDAGGFSQKAFESRFTYSSIERLQRLGQLLTGIKITNLDYREVIHARGDNVFVFLDPPYLAATGSRLYGRNGVLHTSFDHKAFATEMAACEHKWLITYDDSAEIRNDFYFANQHHWVLQYGMNNYRRSTAAPGNELFIFNYEIKRKGLLRQLQLQV